MRKTLDLPDDLLRKAMKVTGQKTNPGAVIAALENLISISSLQRLKCHRGRVNIDLDLDALRKRPPK